MALNPRRSSLFTDDRNGDSDKSEFSTSRIIAGVATAGATFLETQDIQRRLGTGIKELEANKASIIATNVENIRRNIFQKERISAINSRIQTEMIETANEVTGANRVAAYASGLRNSGSVARANEAILSQLNTSRFYASTDAEIRRDEMDRQQSFRNRQTKARIEQIDRQIKELKSRKKLGGIVGVFKGVISVAGIVAAPFTGGASLGISRAANVGVDVGGELFG